MNLQQRIQALCKELKLRALSAEPPNKAAWRSRSYSALKNFRSNRAIAPPSRNYFETIAGVRRERRTSVPPNVPQKNQSWRSNAAAGVRKMEMAAAKLNSKAFDGALWTNFFGDF